MFRLLVIVRDRFLIQDYFVKIIPSQRLLCKDYSVNCNSTSMDCRVGTMKYAKLAAYSTDYHSKKTIPSQTPTPKRPNQTLRLPKSYPESPIFRRAFWHGSSRVRRILRSRRRCHKNDKSGNLKDSKGNRNETEK
jgi:hypothetical protein